jgi:uncharacterized protein (DUF2147 family)
MSAAALLLTAALAAAPIAGQWLTEDGEGVIAIAPCGDRLCGRIAGIADFGPLGMPVDVQGRPQCGLEIIHGLTPDEPGTWAGTITNPEDGRVYQARLSLDEQGRLRLRGYLGIPLFGATQHWTRYAGGLTQGCRMPPPR